MLVRVLFLCTRIFFLQNQSSIDLERYKYVVGDSAFDMKKGQPALDASVAFLEKLNVVGVFLCVALHCIALQRRNIHRMLL